MAIHLNSLADPKRLADVQGLLEQGRLPEARRACLSWLAEAPALAEVSFLLARVAMAQGDTVESLKRYAEVTAGAGDLASSAQLGLAMAQGQLGDKRGAEATLRGLLARTPNHFLAYLRLGELLEARGAEEEALHAYFAAVVHAQKQGRWRGDDTTAPVIRPLVHHAMAFVDAGRRELFLGLLKPLRALHGRAALRRIERGLLIYLGELPARYADSRQQPVFFYVPGLPATPYPDRSMFPWLEELEQATTAIRQEMRVTRNQSNAYAPFLGVDAEMLPPGLLAGERGTPAWDAYFFYRHGMRDENHALQCPATTKALERAPLVRIREHAPEICYSALAPGTHILKHRGITNTRLTVHLPLDIPEDCALVVGGEIHVWQEGRAMVFDDTFEHEAWNRSAHSRVILLMDTWNPHLDEIERAAVTDLVAGIGDFNRRAEPT
jgi:aspartate beta-hydroxylase